VTLEAVNQARDTARPAGSMRMTTLIDDLLNLSKVKRTPLCMEHINLSEIAADIVADFRARDPARQVVVEITEGLTASCDRGLIKVALENLFWQCMEVHSQTTERQDHIFSGEKGRTSVLRARQRSRLRHETCRKAVRAVPTSPSIIGI